MNNLKVLIVANNSRWSSWDQKILQLREWFLPKANLQVTIVNTEHRAIPFQTAPETGPGSYRILDSWYDTNVSIRAAGYDIVLFVMPLYQWYEPNNVWGYRTDRLQGPVELQIAANETAHDDPLLANGEREVVDQFFNRARHEILHALFLITGQVDTTHQRISEGRPEFALGELSFPVAETSSLTAIRAKLHLLLQVIETLRLMQTRFSWPANMNECRVTNPFLRKDSDNYPITGVHPGVDYGTGTGKRFALYSVADGEVIERGKHAAFGNYFFLHVPSVDRTFAYFHLEGDAPQLGPIKRSTPCGYAGNTGLSDGIHLHLECIKGRVKSTDRRKLFTTASRIADNAEDPHAFLKSRISPKVEGEH